MKYVKTQDKNGYDRFYSVDYYGKKKRISRKTYESMLELCAKVCEIINDFEARGVREICTYDISISLHNEGYSYEDINIAIRSLRESGELIQLNDCHTLDHAIWTTRKNVDEAPAMGASGSLEKALKSCRDISCEMKYDEWKRKILTLPKTVEAQITASATMLQPFDYTQQFNCHLTNFHALLIDAVALIQDNYTCATGVQLEPVTVGQNWFYRYYEKACEIISECEIYELLNISVPMEREFLGKVDELADLILESKNNDALTFSRYHDFVNAASNALSDENKRHTAVTVINGIACIMTRLPRMTKDLFFKGSAPNR